MELPYTYLTFVGILLLFLHKGDGAVWWDKNNVDVAQGDDVTVTCRANLVAIDIMRVFLLDEENNSETIADNDQLKTLFAETNRYQITYKYDKDESTGEVTVTYTGIRGEDAGQVGCFVLGDQDSQSYVNLQVRVPIKEVYIALSEPGSSEMKVAPGDSVQLRENSDRSLVCVAETDGSNSAPEMIIKVAGHDVTHEFTEHFQVLTSETNGYKGLPKQGSIKRMEYRTTNPSPDFNNKHLECIARRPSDEKSLRVSLQVAYSPSITCERYDYFQEAGKSISFTCDIKANPGPHVQWYYEQEHENYTLAKHPAYGSIKEDKQTISSDHTKITFTIENIESSHFTRYILKLSNAFGEARKTILLEEGVVEVETEPTPQVIPEYVPTSTERTGYDVINTEKSTEQEKEKPQVTVKGTNPQESRFNSSSRAHVDIMMLCTCALLYLVRSTSIS